MVHLTWPYSGCVLVGGGWNCEHLACDALKSEVCHAERTQVAPGQPRARGEQGAPDLRV